MRQLNIKRGGNVRALIVVLCTGFWLGGGLAGAWAQSAIDPYAAGRAPAVRSDGAIDPYAAAPAAPAEPPVITAPTDDGADIDFMSPLASMPLLHRIQPDKTPVVVELFTSQGCSSCPPADAMLSDLASHPGVLPLAFHVDYWDYLGWSDSFARPEFSARQQDYARAAGERAIYTPQLIVDGEETGLAPRPADVMAMIEARRTAPAVLNIRQQNTGGTQVIELYPLSALDMPATVTLVRFAPSRQVHVTAGENRGRDITYSNVVLDLQELAIWNGAEPLRLTIAAGGAADDSFPSDTQHAIIVQKQNKGRPGTILAALPLE